MGMERPKQYELKFDRELPKEAPEAKIRTEEIEPSDLKIGMKVLWNEEVWTVAKLPYPASGERTVFLEMSPLRAATAKYFDGEKAELVISE
jgi:hypothetical protein